MSVTVTFSDRLIERLKEMSAARHEIYYAEDIADARANGGDWTVDDRLSGYTDDGDVDGAFEFGMTEALGEFAEELLALIP